MRLKMTLLLLLGWTVSASAANWSYWRGPEQNGVSRERDLPEKWSLKENLIFRTDKGSITTPIVQDGRVYLLGKTGEGPTQQETVMAFDADTGKPLWEKAFNVWLTDIVEDRIGFTHMVGDPETGNVYAHLTSGEFICFDKTGKDLWRHSLTEEFGRVSGYGGRITSAIIDEDKVILSLINSSWGELTVGNTRMVAFDKKTGKVVWWGSGNYRVKDTYYASPVVAVIGGQRLILTGGGDGCIHAFQVRTGKKVWSHKFEDGGGAINCSPVVKGDRIWVGHGEENLGNGTQGRVICLDASGKGDPKEVWRYDGLKAKFAAPILHDGLLYVCDDAGKLFCFDADKGGEPLWSFAYGRNTKGSPVWADGKIYVSEVDSKFHILKPSREGCEKLHSYTFRSKTVAPVELHGAPAVVNGRVYFTTTQGMYCIGKKGHDTPADPIPEPVKEPNGPPGKAAWLQVVPADATVRPGGGVEFKAYTFDEAGRRVGEAKAEWEKGGMLPPVYPIGLTPPPSKAGTPPPLAGELNGSTFTAAKAPNGQFGRVVAKADGLTAHARVRVAPNLPYAQDFDKLPEGRTPAAWVNTMAKFSVVKLPTGDIVLRKRNDNASPLVARANAYVGDPNWGDYTIECDVYGTKVRGKDMPDMGVGACRYTFTLHGNDREVRLVTWDAQKRIEKKLEMDWKPETWYRMKLTATVVNGKGVVKGKVWERSAKEPAEWTLELEDPVPNAEGAPLLFGFANGTINAKDPGAEIFYDNLRITPNKK